MTKTRCSRSYDLTETQLRQDLDRTQTRPITTCFLDSILGAEAGTALLALLDVFEGGQGEGKGKGEGKGQGKGKGKGKGKGEGNGDDAGCLVLILSLLLPCLGGGLQ